MLRIRLGVVLPKLVFGLVLGKVSGVVLGEVLDEVLGEVFGEVLGEVFGEVPGGVFGALVAKGRKHAALEAIIILNLVGSNNDVVTSL